MNRLRDVFLKRRSLLRGSKELLFREESLGLLKRSWRKNDRKTYYRTADDIATALHQGLLILVRNKMGLLANELHQAEDELKQGGESDETVFMLGRVQRAKKLRDTAMAVLENPFVKLLTRVK